MHNICHIKTITIVVHLWTSQKHWQTADDGCKWQDLFENNHGLRDLAPCLEQLVIDFEPSNRGKSQYYAYVDGGDTEDDSSPRQPGFDSFRDTLKRMVRVEKVSVWNLKDHGLEIATEKEMMGKADYTNH
ncbi:hypothetical protein MMC11_004943 [Xylographa trunciseda]|nr:hypothetical protein [Xylographa trunciseda]